MLSAAAFNALLKTLEEPPGHVKFIFATTEAHKLPDTILSRCQRHNFRRIPAGAMLKRLKEIVAEGEGEGLRLLAVAVGAPVRGRHARRAVAARPGAVGLRRPSRTDEAVAEALGAIDRTAVHAFATALVKRDAKALLLKVEEMWNRGVDCKRLAEELAWYLRHVFVAKATGAAPEELADSDREAVLGARARRRRGAAGAAVRRGARRHLGRGQARAQPRLALRDGAAQGRAPGARAARCRTSSRGSSASPRAPRTSARSVRRSLRFGPLSRLSAPPRRPAQPRPRSPRAQRPPFTLSAVE